MYKARIGKYDEVSKKTSSFSYYMNPDIREAIVVKLDDNYMIDIENNEFYPIVKRNSQGYLDTDIELNKEYVISYEPVKDIDYKTYLKGATAKIQGLLNKHYEKELNKAAKKQDKEKTMKLVK